MASFFFENKGNSEIIVGEALSKCTQAELDRIKKIPNITDVDVAIWALSNRWFKDCIGSEQTRMSASLAQLNFIMHAVGPMLSLLTDAEWQKVESRWNHYLYIIRTFNSNYLGYYIIDGKINELTADYYNIIAWQQVIVYYFSAEISKYLRIRIPDEKLYFDIKNIESNELHNQLSLEAVNIRLAVNDEISGFIREGLEICDQCPPGSNWADYYLKYKNKVTIPRFSIS